MISLEVTDIVKDEGTIVLFEGKTDTGETWQFAADHRPARAIVDALAAHEPDVRVTVEPWQAWRVK